MLLLTSFLKVRQGGAFSYPLLPPPVHLWSRVRLHKQKFRFVPSNAPASGEDAPHGLAGVGLRQEEGEVLQDDRHALDRPDDARQKKIRVEGTEAELEK